MSLGLSRVELRALAKAKIADAVLLLENKRFSNAYYLAGYAIEFALKACIAKQIVGEVIPHKAFIEATFKHSPKALIAVAGLSAALKQREQNDSAFGANWALV